MRNERRKILEDYPELEEEDIKQALKFAAWVVSEKQIPMIKMRFLLDMPISPKTEKFLRNLGYDAVRVDKLGMENRRGNNSGGKGSKRGRQRNNMRPSGSHHH